MPPVKKHYKMGESVFGLWPGSGGLYFKGVIVDSDPADGTYDVKFEEGTTYTLLDKHIRSSDSFKTLEPKSSKRVDVKKARGRQRSVSRSRSRSRTPGPRPKSPENKSSSFVRRSSRQNKKLSESEIKPSPERELTNLKVKVESNEYEVDNSYRRSPRVQSVTKFYGAKEEEDLDNISLSRRKSSRLASKIKVQYG